MRTLKPERYRVIESILEGFWVILDDETGMLAKRDRQPWRYADCSQAERKAVALNRAWRRESAKGMLREAPELPLEAAVGSSKPRKR